MVTRLWKMCHRRRVWGTVLGRSKSYVVSNVLLLRAAWDMSVWVLALPLAALLRYDGAPEQGFGEFILLGVACGLLQGATGILLRLYRGRYRAGSFDEIFGLAVCAFVVAAIAWLLNFFIVTPTARSIPLIGALLALALMFASRFGLRAIRLERQVRRPGRRALIYGAGDAGSQIALLLLNDPHAMLTPVGFLDDDPAKRKLHVHRLKVLGAGVDLDRVVVATGAQVLLVAISRATASQLAVLDEQCARLNVQLQVIPSAIEIASGTAGLSDIADISLEDLLGRNPIDADEVGIRALLHGKRILITGAGGSIGSELARQVHVYEPSLLTLLDRDESGLHATQLSIDGQGLLDDPSLVLADIRDTERVSQVLEEARPDVVFHAAALKHLTLLERYPEEAFKTNVEGTRNLLHAAHQVGVTWFINISTDKAADPTSVLGRTKFITEQMVADFAARSSTDATTRYMSVRFGNVLGSRGSVLTTFRHQIKHGGPVTVTHPDVTRYFMTIPEAVHLVLQAALIGESGETLILDMGEPVRIADVARKMVEKSGRSIEIIYTGLRRGEKLHEVLLNPEETARRGRHPLISHTRVARDSEVHE